MVEQGLILNNTAGVPPLTLNREYTVAGPNAGRYTVSHKWATDYKQVVAQLSLLLGSGVKVVYLGLPLLHMLYDPDWGGYLPVCDSGFDMRAASHGMLDMLTSGGLGPALWWPWSSERIFAPIRPILVSPIGVEAFVSQRGLAVLLSELKWVWLPAAMVTATVLGVRKAFHWQSK